jgi:nucleoside-diphosphate-sugar epimerase
MSKLIFGCGYLGKRIAKLWQEAGETVFVVTRSSSRAGELQSEGFQTLVADVTCLEALVNLPAAETVLFAVGYDRAADASIAEVYAGGVKNVLAALPSSVERFIYISTTGVYGGADGDWVDETTPPNPQREGGKASLAAEQLLGPNSVILRLAGIYGPDRIPYLAQLRAGEPIAAPSEGWLNLIHVDEGAKIVLMAEAWTKLQANGQHVFCVSDGQPVVRGEYYREVARLIGSPVPTFALSPANSPAAARASADRRVNNAKLIRSLQIDLAYPSYREGLAAILNKAESH